MKTFARKVCKHSIVLLHTYIVICLLLFDLWVKDAPHAQGNTQLCFTKQTGITKLLTVMLFAYTPSLLALLVYRNVCRLQSMRTKRDKHDKHIHTSNHVDVEGV